MTTAATAAASSGTPDENSAGTPDTAGGDIDRLHAFDGLFLRAEHLNRIQDYAREFASAIGRSGGPGVVEGYRVAVEQGALKVTGGLAVDAAGRPLRSRHEVTLPLKDLRAGADAFWWVEVSRLDWDYGDTAVQGLLCEDPCAGATTSKQFTAEGVRISLTADRATGLEEQFGVNRRNWLASRLFAAGQADDTPWLATPAVLPADWEPPVEYPRPPVRLALLIPVGPDVSQWIVDTWTARREVGAPPPERWWQGRLGMRPWNAYAAQILQFQDQLAQWRDPRAGGAAAAERAADTALAEEIRRIVGMAQGARSRLALSMKEALERAAREDGARRDAALPAVPPLTERGFGDLPPAGYLPVQSDRQRLEQEVRRVLGDRLDLRFCEASRADIAEAVQQAQHRDRIVLDSAAEVEVLVPVGPVGPVTASAVDGGWTGGWVAFVRSRQVSCWSPGVAAPPEAAAPTAAEPSTAPPTAEPGDGR
ncbi:hypothetical protein [Streptomyces rubellomurinus]|uniref:Uncharacterized protein n=1 Tax=Streptomyces rubellomurinus (strain ATCC 31215) TaxID=359131 RepID=A0A0F2TB80_STRR3|nr:hypothetical protein [Streptomyces rubellomurinus]KJS59590.1 hypothetical protein VM95_26355 [Streptomyces rubellomurinus]